jgi:hypothetical protein
MAVEMHKNYCAHVPNLKNRGKRAVAKNGVFARVQCSTASLQTAR